MPTLASKLPYTHPFAGGYPRLGGQPLPTDPDAVDYLNRVAAADGAAVEVGVAMAVDAFVRGCKADGIWSALKASCIMCGARTISGALVPLAGDAPTPYNFASGDYSRTAGLKGDGSTKYLDSNRANNADPEDSKHLSFYASSLTTVADSLYAGSLVTSPSVSATQLQKSGTDLAGFCNSSTGSFGAFATDGRFAGVSLNGTSQTIRADGNTDTVAVSTVPHSINAFIFCRNNSGTAERFVDARLAFYSIGSALDLAALDSRVSTLVTAIAAAI